jgi:hypothetical protein
MRKTCLGLLLSFLFVAGIAFHAGAAADKQVPKIGPVKINAHPASLEGKTVVLRWNGKPNGDKFLTRFGEILSQQVKGVKVVKMWEVDKTTAIISKTPETSKAIADKIAAYKPAIVIASQAD